MRLAVLAGIVCAAALAQSTPESLRPVLSERLHSGEVVDYQLRQYVRRLVPPVPEPRTASEWTAQARELRRRVIEQIAFHGWPKEWIEAPTRMVDHGLIATAKGYRLRKLSYEVIPGFTATALLYEPENPRGRVSAILNFNGHELGGKAEEYIQKRCINHAIQGMYALSTEWIGTGELRHPENTHWFGAHIDFAGANVLGLFYLEMRRALDYLYEHPGVDRARIGVTGLSGGGWQSIMLGALDERVLAAAPVAGYLPAVSFGAVEHAGDNEQTATDLSAVADYPALTAMRAPRPTLLIYNAEDNCCFRAPRMKTELFDRVKPFFALYGKENEFAWHENTDPGTHNYQRENRLVAYRFFAKCFGLPEVREEAAVDGWIKSAQELAVGLPQDNLTLLGVARKLAERTTKARGSAARLREILRYKPVAVERAWMVANTKSKGIETHSYRLDFVNGLSATGVLMEAIGAAGSAATIILNDNGKSAAGAQASERVNRGERVLCVDLVFTGDAAPKKFHYPDHDRMLVSLGDRSLGLRAAQLEAIARWFTPHGVRARIETQGIRSQTVARVLAAMEPSLFTEVIARGGARTLKHLLDAPLKYEDAPEVFCPDLYGAFDFIRVTALARPSRITNE